MSPGHFFIVVAICLIWALNTVLSRIVMAYWDVPPLFYACLRFAIVTAFMLPWLRKVPRPFWRMFVVAMLINGVGFPLYVMGLQDASPSSVAIVSQIGVPATTLLSVIVLGEVIRWRRVLGIALAVVGIVILLWRPEAMRASMGLWLVVISALMSAVAVIMFKKMDGIEPLQYQAWGGALSVPPLIVATFALETGQVEAVQRAGWPLLAVLLYAAVMVSIVSHSLYYWINRRHDAALIAPLMVMAPLFTVGLGIWITGDVVDMRMAVGAVVTLAGVLIILLRPNAVLPLATMIMSKLR